MDPIRYHGAGMGQDARAYLKYGEYYVNGNADTGYLHGQLPAVIPSLFFRNILPITFPHLSFPPTIYDNRII